MPTDPNDDLPAQRTVISVTGIEVFGFHGALERERVRGVRLRVDVEASACLTDATADSLENTVDYRLFERTVRAVNRRSQYILIESYAKAIADELISAESRLVSVTVRVSKLRPEGMARGVTPSVAVTRGRP